MNRIRLLLWRDGRAMFVSAEPLSRDMVEIIRRQWDEWRGGDRTLLVLNGAEVEFVEVEPGALSVLQGTAA